MTEQFLNASYAAALDVNGSRLSKTQTLNVVLLLPNHMKLIN